VVVVCVGFVMCVSFGSMCTCIYCVLYCYVFLLVLSVLPLSDNSIADSSSSSSSSSSSNTLKLLLLTLSTMCNTESKNAASETTTMFI
jgi:hypothetical protein